MFKNFLQWNHLVLKFFFLKFLKIVNLFFFAILGPFKLSISYWVNCFLRTWFISIRLSNFCVSSFHVGWCLRFSLTLTHLFSLFLLPSQAQWSSANWDLSELDSSLGILAYSVLSHVLTLLFSFSTPEYPTVSKMFYFSFKSHSKTESCLSHFPLNSSGLHFLWQFCCVDWILPCVEGIFEHELMAQLHYKLFEGLNPVWFFSASFLGPGTG